MRRHHEEARQRLGLLGDGVEAMLQTLQPLPLGRNDAAFSRPNYWENTCQQWQRSVLARLLQCFSFWLIESLMFDPSIHATSCLVQLHGLQSGTGVSPLSCFDFLPPRYPRAEFSGSMCPPLQRGPVWCQRGLSRDGHVPTALAFRPKTLTMLGYSSPL